MDFEVGGMGVEEGEDGEAIESSELGEPADGVDVFGLWESVDLGRFWEGCACDCHCLSFLNFGSQM